MLYKFKLVHHVLHFRGCQDNGAIYEVINLDSLFNLTAELNYRAVSQNNSMMYNKFENQRNVGIL